MRVSNSPLVGDDSGVVMIASFLARFLTKGLMVGQGQPLSRPANKCNVFGVGKRVGVMSRPNSGGSVAALKRTENPEILGVTSCCLMGRKEDKQVKVREIVLLLAIASLQLLLRAELAS